MSIEYRGAVVVLDDGGGHVPDLVERISTVFPEIYRVAEHEEPESDGHVVAVGRKHLNIKTVVHQMVECEAHWALVPRQGDPTVAIADYLSAARPHLAGGVLGFVLISGHPGRRYRHVAVVLDVSEPITTGTLALAAIGMAWRSGAQLDVLMLGADLAVRPTSWEDAKAIFNVHEDADENLTKAMETAHQIGRSANWIPLGESTNRDQLVLDAVRDSDYDLVIDDLRPVDVGPRIGRLKRVRKQLIDGDSIDTAYRLLRDAPCDVGIVVDAVRMNLVPANYAKAGAVAALSLGVLGAATLPVATSASAAEYVPAVEAPLDPAAESAGTAEAEAAPAETAAPEAPAPVGAPAPALETIPADVSSEQMAAVEASAQAEQDALAAEQAELAALQQQAAAASSAVTSEQVNLALEQQEVYDAQATLESAAEALEYAEGSQDDLSEAEESQALGSYNRAAHDVESAQEDVEEAEAALAAAEAQADAAAEAVAAQQASVDAQAANVGSWDAFAAAADTNTAQVVAPVAGYSISTHYGVSGEHWSSGHHTGTDFAAPQGTAVMAAADGVVTFAGTNGPYGNQVQIEHEDGSVTTYSHLSQINVDVGQTVGAGDVIGEVGSTGNSTGPHLHFEVHDANGNTLDSDAWLMESGVA